MIFMCNLICCGLLLVYKDVYIIGVPSILGLFFVNDTLRTHVGWQH